MSKAESFLLSLAHTNRLSSVHTGLHAIDPRAKVIATLAGILTIVSHDRYTLIGLLPYASYPLFLALWGQVPAGYVFSRLLVVSPFAVFVGIFNPLIDRTPLVQVYSITISAGWVSFLSLLLRFVLTVSAALVMVAVTGFREVCMALGRMHVPRAIVVQLLFLHRYISLIASEAARMIRAYRLRSFGSSGLSLKGYARLTGTLLLRSYDRAQRIYSAMLCRGFDGTIRVRNQLHFRSADTLFLAGWIAFFIMVRLVKPGEALTHF